MRFEKKTFLELFNSLLPVEKAVFSETVYDLAVLNYRKKYFLPKWLRINGYRLKTVPDDRKLLKKIEEVYDLAKKQHIKMYIENMLICLAFLKTIGIVDYSKFTFTLFYPRYKLVFVDAENLKELLSIMKTFDKETLKIPLYKIVYDEPAIILEGAGEISRTRYEMQAERVFEYVLSRPNRDISIDEINEYQENKLQKGRITRDLDDIFDDMGFKADLGKVFLKKKTKNIIHLRNPVYFSDLKEIGLDYCEPAELLRKHKGLKKDSAPSKSDMRVNS